MKTIFKIIAMTATLVAGTALADAPSYVEIDQISYGGTGCPQGSVSENISDDNLAFTLLFDEYVAEIGPGVSRREARKACQITLDLKFPQGWSFTIFEADYRGYASLDRKVTGEQKSSYYFQGQRGSVSLKTKFRGEIDEDYEATDRLGLSAQVWSPCGANRALNIKTQVRLTSRDRRASGILTVDSVDGELAHVYGIKWKRCRH
jgi:hypothetical protein